MYDANKSTPGNIGEAPTRARVNAYSMLVFYVVVVSSMLT